MIYEWNQVFFNLIIILPTKKKPQKKPTEKPTNYLTTSALNTLSTSPKKKKKPNNYMYL